MSYFTGKDIVSNIINSGCENEKLSDSNFNLKFPEFNSFKEVIDFIREHKLEDIRFPSYMLRKRVSDGKLIISFRIDYTFQIGRSCPSFFGKFLSAYVRNLVQDEWAFKLLVEKNPNPSDNQYSLIGYLKQALSLSLGIDDNEVSVKQHDTSRGSLYRVTAYCNKTEDFDIGLAKFEKNLLSQGYVINYSSEYILFDSKIS